MALVKLDKEANSLGVQRFISLDAARHDFFSSLLFLKPLLLHTLITRLSSLLASTPGYFPQLKHTHSHKHHHPCIGASELHIVPTQTWRCELLFFFSFSKGSALPRQAQQVILFSPPLFLYWGISLDRPLFSLFACLGNDCYACLCLFFCFVFLHSLFCAD